MSFLGIEFGGIKMQVVVGRYDKIAAEVKWIETGEEI
jgi:hypothetical protein